MQKNSSFYILKITSTIAWVLTITTTTILLPFVQEYLGELVPAETFTHLPIQIIIQPLAASSIYYNP